MATQKIAIIKANWHLDMNDRARDGLLAGLGEDYQTEEFLLPGALEIPLKAQQLARTGEYAAIVCIGFVVNGGIYRHEFVAQAVLDGIMRVNLDEGVPVLSVVLTPHNYHDSKEHRRFFLKHMVEKGAEAAKAVRMLLDQ